MTYWLRIGACVVASLVGHWLLYGGLDQLPAQPVSQRPRIVTMHVVPPPPPPEEPPPEPPPPQEEPVEVQPQQVIHEAPAELPKPKPRKPPRTPPKDARPKDVPATERPATSGETTDMPTFGVSMESTSAGGHGPAVPVGNTLQQAPQAGPRPPPDKVKPLGAPVPTHEVTKMPVPRGRCQGGYTEAARAAAVEGTVVLELVVGEDGATRDIRVLQGLGHGLDEAAVAAVKACRFTPGERGGVAVPVRIRSFKIRFFLQDDD